MSQPSKMHLYRRCFSGLSFSSYSGDLERGERGKKGRKGGGRGRRLCVRRRTCTANETRNARARAERERAPSYSSEESSFRMCFLQRDPLRMHSLHCSPVRADRGATNRLIARLSPCLRVCPGRPARAHACVRVCEEEASEWWCVPCVFLRLARLFFFFHPLFALFLNPPPHVLFSCRTFLSSRPSPPSKPCITTS